jgi:hypothetical protein
MCYVSALMKKRILLLLSAITFAQLSLTLSYLPRSFYTINNSYPINLQADPFSFPPPLADFDERTPVVGQASKHLLLYSGKQLEEINWNDMLIAVGG